jgi:hypothetical protein
LDYFTDVPAPTIQRFLALSQKVVPLINGRHSRNRPRLMVENLVRDMRRNAQSRHSRNDRASQIIKSPTSDAAQLVNGPLFSSKALKPLSPRGAKDVRFARAGIDYVPGRWIDTLPVPRKRYGLLGRWLAGLRRKGDAERPQGLSGDVSPCRR